MFLNPQPATRSTTSPDSTATRRCVALGLLASAVAAGTVLAGASSAFAQSAADRVAQDVAKVNDAYLMGPKAASELGCTIAWQSLVPLPNGPKITLVSASPDGILALNSRNEISLVRPSTGDRAWTASAAQQVDRVLSAEIVQVLTRDGQEPRVMVTTDTVAYGLDFKDGASLLRGRFRHVPSTAPIVVGRGIVFGSRGGQVAWFDCATGFDMSAYTVDGPYGKSPIVAAPTLGDGVIVAGSSEGTVVGLDAVSGASLWRKSLLGGVSARPAIANGVAFVASQDQYLYAFDLGSGVTLWKYFTQTPLETSPFPAGSVVLQDIPGEGLVAFTQNPEGQIGGEVRWKKKDLPGAPIGTARLRGADAVLLWCSKGRKVTMVDLANGDVVGTVELPKVEHLEADSLEAGGFVAWSSDGRILRLSPAQSAAAAAPKG
jgi:outer membrane protein assembly factor BamB